MTALRQGPLRGRQGEARRNDDLVLKAARDVFAEQGYAATMSAIAKRAGVGVASLYSRYPSKEQLARELSIVGMDKLVIEARAALDVPDAWEGFLGFMQKCVEGGAGGLMQLAGTFPTSDEHRSAIRRLRRALDELLHQTKAHGGLRHEVTAADIYLLLASLRMTHPTRPDQTPQLRSRYLCLVCDGLRAVDGELLPGRPPTWTNLERLWTDPVGKPRQ